MTLKLHEIRDNHGARTAPKIVGRGIGSGLGKTCGRGGKGQTARSGVSLNGFEGGQNPIYRRLPKRGFVNIHRKELFELTLEKLSAWIQSGFLDGAVSIDLALLKTLGVARTRHKGISVFGEGNIDRAVVIVADRVSQKAREMIEKIGGKISVLERSASKADDKTDSQAE
jgi:large subunit ribosomal protein L15